LKYLVLKIDKKRQLFFTIFFSVTQAKKLNLDNTNVPNSDMAPHAAHMIKLRPIDPVLISNPVGETNIPEPVSTIKY